MLFPPCTQMQVPAVVLAECSSLQQRLGRRGTFSAYLLVPGEDPDADARIGQALDALGHPLLQLVLNGCAAQQYEVPLNQLPRCCQLLVSPCQGGLCCKELLLPPAVESGRIES